VGKLSRGDDVDVWEKEPVSPRRIQLVAPPPLIGPPPQPRPDAPRGAITAREIGLVVVSIMSAAAVIAFYRLTDTPPAPRLASAPATRVVIASVADEPAGPATAQPAATAFAAAPPTPAPSATVSVPAPADTRSPAAEPQASEPRRAMSPEQHQAMVPLVARGKELLRSGDFSSARLILERAADAGEAEAALTLGSTYDPTALTQLGIRRQVANIDLARNWYEKAQEFGSTEASSRLKTLPNY